MLREFYRRSPGGRRAQLERLFMPWRVMDYEHFDCFCVAACGPDFWPSTIVVLLLFLLASTAYRDRFWVSVVLMLAPLLYFGVLVVVNYLLLL